MTSALEVEKETILRAITVKAGDGGVVFDADQGAFRAGWTGGFLNFSPARYGLIEKPNAGGPFQWVQGGWSGYVVYKGLYLHGDRVVLSYEVDGTAVLDTVRVDEKRIVRTLEVAPHVKPLALELNKPAAEGNTRISLVMPETKDRSRCSVNMETGLRLGKEVASENVLSLTRPGPARWKTLETRGQLGREKGPYVVDTLTVPYDNPWKALMFLSGLDFFRNGDAAVSTIHGDVWIVSGIDEKLEKLTWRRYATGLYQALGLKIVDDKVYVLGRDRITKLHDLNGDGEADYYESFCGDLPTSAKGHDYITCLETDAAGNFYFVSWHGLYKVSPD